MKSSIYKRITSFAVVIVFYTKQAMAGIFLIPPVVYIASVVISVAGLGAIYSMDKKPVLKVNSQPNTAWNSSINVSTERGPESMSTVKVVPLPSRLLKYPMRERNLSPHGFDFSDFLFAS